MLEEVEEEDRRRQKEENKREYARREAERKERESKDSYLNLHQFDYMYEKLQLMKRRVKSQQDVIDGMEARMIKIIERRKDKEQTWVDDKKKNQ